MTDLPAVVDIRDDLQRIREVAGDGERDEDRADDVDEHVDLDDELDEIADRLDELATREDADRKGVLDGIGDRLLAVQTRLDGEAARRAEVARNRVQIYRDATHDGVDDLVVVNARFRASEDSAPEAFADVTERAGLVTATVVNADGARDARVVVEFHDADGDLLDEVAGPEFSLEERGQETVEVEVDAPADADQYSVTAVDAAAFSETRGSVDTDFDADFTYDA